jgi:transcriptional regulator with XRE-family HTH domain
MRRVDGAKVRALRDQRQLTQEQLAAKAGISKSTVVNIEQGQHQRRPYWPTLRVLADALGVQVDDLMTDDDAAGVPP